MSGKTSVRAVVTAHLDSFRGYDSKWTNLRDLSVFVIGPVVIGALIGWRGPDVQNVAAVLTGVGVFTALLFGLLVNILNLSIKLRRDEGLHPDSPLRNNIEELFANVAWTVLAGLFLSVLLACGAAVQTPGEALPGLFVGVLVAVFLHVIATVVMSVTRLFDAHGKIGELAPPRKKGGDPSSVRHLGDRRSAG